MPEIVTQNDYAANGERDVKFTAANCHGNSAHCFGVMNLFLAAGEIGPKLTELGASYTRVPMHPISEVMPFIQSESIIVFHEYGGISHSAYVVSLGQNPGGIIIWACNAGVPNQGTAAGFDEVTLQEYFDAHPNLDGVSFYNDIE
jgi:hypothetical protein